MATDSSARFTIHAGGKHRRLFSISENSKKGTLYLKIKRSPRVSLPGPFGINAGPMLLLPQTVKTQKYSIHPSPTSKENINYIHHTIEMESGETLESQHVTKAIKSGETFAFLYCTRCADLRLPFYELDDSGVPNISLGGLNPDIFTLFYAVIVGAVAREWPISVPDHIRIHNETFGKLRLIVLWSFIALPSIRESLTYHMMTAPPDATKEGELDKGLSPQQCIDKFDEQCWILEDGVRRHYVQNHCDLIPGQPITFPMRRYFPDGETITDKTKEYGEALRMRVLTL